MPQVFKLKGDTLGVWDLDDLTLKDAFVIKAATGLDPVPLTQGLKQGSPQAWQAVVWFLLQRQNPGLPLSSVDFRYGDIEIEDVTVPETPEVPDGTRPTPEVVDFASSETTTSTSSPAGAVSVPAMSTP